MESWDRIIERKTYLDQLPVLSNGSMDRLDEDFSLQFNYNSNAIEGSTLTEQDTRLIVKEGVTPSGAPAKDVTAAIGHQKAYQYIRDMIVKDNAAILSEDLIKSVHQLVLMGEPEDAGRYRDVPVYIGNDDVVLPSPAAVPGRMKNLIAKYPEWVENDAIKALAWMHLEFESIHPFVDGNGRTGRLVMNYELMRQGYPPIDIKQGDAPRYYDCFRAYQGADENAAPMEYLVAEYVLAALDERIAIIEEAIRIREEQDMER